MDLEGLVELIYAAKVAQIEASTGLEPLPVSSLTEDEFDETAKKHLLKKLKKDLQLYPPVPIPEECKLVHPMCKDPIRWAGLSAKAKTDLYANKFLPYLENWKNGKAGKHAPAPTASTRSTSRSRRICTTTTPRWRRSMPNWRRALQRSTTWMKRHDSGLASPPCPGGAGAAMIGHSKSIERPAATTPATGRGAPARPAVPGAGTTPGSGGLGAVPGSRPIRSMCRRCHSAKSARTRPAGDASRPHINQGLFGCFIPAIREKGVKRAMALLSTDKVLAADFQAILDQCPAPWWDPVMLWDRAKDRTAEVFADHHLGTAHALLGQAPLLGSRNSTNQLECARHRSPGPRGTHVR